MDMINKLFVDADRYVSESLEEKRFYSRDKNLWAAATIGCVRDTKTGEIVNGSIYIRTSGGMYYKTPDYRFALERAEWLVKEWDNGNFDAEKEIQDG